MQIYFGEPDEKHTLDEALSLAPAWKNMYISRHRLGWVFVNAHGRYFVLDDNSQHGYHPLALNNKHGWISTDTEIAARVYTALGGRVSKIYYEEE